MYRIGVFGNNRLAINVATEISLRNDCKLVVLIPEGKDLVNRSDPEFGTDWESSFEDYAKSSAIPGLLGDINEFASELSDMGLDLLVGCRSNSKVSQEILDIPQFGVTNFHYGALPKYGGCHTIAHAILNGEKEIGVTFHFMNKDFDKGPIIAQHMVKGADQNSAYDLYLHANHTAHHLFVHYLDKALAGDCEPQEGESTYYKADSINFAEDSIIQVLDEPVDTVLRKIRAFYFPPLQLPKLNFKRFTVEVSNFRRTYV